MVSLLGGYRVVGNQARHACRARPDGGTNRGPLAGADRLFAGKGAEPVAGFLKGTRTGCVGRVERKRNPSKPVTGVRKRMGFAEFIIGRAFARPVGSTHPTI